MLNADIRHQLMGQLMFGVGILVAPGPKLSCSSGRFLVLLCDVVAVDIGPRS